jgi:hypothetical protein
MISFWIILSFLNRASNSAHWATDERTFKLSTKRNFIITIFQVWNTFRIIIFTTFLIWFDEKLKNDENSNRWSFFPQIFFCVTQLVLMKFKRGYYNFRVT